MSTLKKSKIDFYKCPILKIPLTKGQVMDKQYASHGFPMVYFPLFLLQKIYDY